MRTQNEPGAGTPTRESTGSEPSTRAIRNPQGSRFRPGSGEGSDRRLLTAEELTALGRPRDPELAGTSRARYAPWDMTDLAVDEIVSEVAQLLKAGAALWTPRNTRHWATWVAFCLLRGLDPRVDADADRLAAYTLAALTNGLAPKTVRDHLRSIVRVSESVPPTLRTCQTRAADAQTLTHVWTQLGRAPRRQPAPVVPLGHLLAMARHLRRREPETHLWLTVAYARATRSGEPLRLVTDSIQVEEHLVRVFVERTKTRPEGEWVDIPRLRGWGDDDELDVGAALESLSDTSGQRVIELSFDQVSYRLRRAAAATGVTGWSTRTPRRSRATHVLLDGGDRDLIQWLLRHDDPRSTDCYIDALWGYAYDTDRAAAVLLDPSPPVGGPIALADVRGPQPVRTRTRLSDFAASAQPMDQLVAQARGLLSAHAPGGRVHSSGYLQAGRRFLNRFDQWCRDTFGRTVDLHTGEGETSMLVYVTARLQGFTSYNGNANTLSNNFDAARAVLGSDAPALTTVKRALAGARRESDHRKTPATAATAADVEALLHDVPGLAAIGSLGAGQRREALTHARDNVAWCGAFVSAARLADLRQARVDGMVRVPGLGWVAYLPVSKGARHQPTERDVLVFPARDDVLDFDRQLQALLALRHAVGIDEPWLLSRTRRLASTAQPISPSTLARRLSRRAVEVGCGGTTGHSFRHGRIAELADDGQSLEALRRWLRHHDHDTVPVYAAQAHPGWLWRQVLAAVEDES